MNNRKNSKLFLLFMICILILSGCSSASPGNTEIKEIVYGVYFLDASILEKTECEITEVMADEGHTNIWLVHYLLESSDKPNSFVITETLEGEWQLYVGSYIRGHCPN